MSFLRPLSLPIFFSLFLFLLSPSHTPWLSLSLSLSLSSFLLHVSQLMLSRMIKIESTYSETFPNSQLRLLVSAPLSIPFSPAPCRGTRLIPSEAVNAERYQAMFEKPDMDQTRPFAKILRPGLYPDPPM